LKHLVTLLFLVLAIALYGRGLLIPANAFLVLGMVAEGVFWWRVMQWRHERRAPPTS
jgi:hypothetical protein